MGDVRVELHLAGVKGVLNDDGVLAFVRGRCESIAASADAMMPDNGYTRAVHHEVIEGRTPKGNREVSVRTRSDMAKAMQAKHGTLTRALSSGG